MQEWLVEFCQHSGCGCKGSEAPNAKSVKKISAFSSSEKERKRDRQRKREKESERESVWRRQRQREG